ncbi:hypothetical protein CH75_23950 [Dyella jiangningensis]|nr:hypothetical protein CH75_00870 [Dyella jiangningensis]AHX16490.1 hypothetical protein CH75_23950 [Dyella jiangningensis]
MKMTLKKLTEMIAEGRGIGVGDKYQPWEQITRRRGSPFSNLNLTPVPHLVRLAHFLSRGEREFGFLLWWLGVEDLREQYPLWPWPHRQPVSQVDPESGGVTTHPGMAEVAGEAGIKLGKYPGLAVPVVLSLDLLATVPPDIGPHRLVGFSCKPKALFHAWAPDDRLRERLELDRRYCVTAEIPHRLIHPEQIPRTLIVQLHWLAPIVPFAAISKLLASHTYQAFLDRIKTSAYALPASNAASEAARRLGLSEQDAQQMLRIAIWYQHVDADPTRPISMTRPLRPGGLAIREQLRTEFFGRSL